jgi:hypothetical protein
MTITANLPWIAKFCSRCGRKLEEVWVQDGYDSIEGGPRYDLHMRCPKKVRTAWQAYWRGDHHDETIVFPDDPPRPEIGDPGRLSIAVVWKGVGE